MSGAWGCCPVLFHSMKRNSRYENGDQATCQRGPQLEASWPVGLGEDQAAVPRATAAPCSRHISGHATRAGGGNHGIRNVGGRVVTGSSRRPHPCHLLRQTGLPPAKTGSGDGPKCLVFFKRYRENTSNLRVEVSMDSISPPPPLQKLRIITSYSATTSFSPRTLWFSVHRWQGQGSPAASSLQYWTNVLPSPVWRNRNSLPAKNKKRSAQLCGRMLSHADCSSVARVFRSELLLFS